MDKLNRLDPMPMALGQAKKREASAATLSGLSIVFTVPNGGIVWHGFDEAPGASYTTYTILANIKCEELSPLDFAEASSTPDRVVVMVDGQARLQAVPSASAHPEGSSHTAATTASASSNLSGEGGES